LGKFIARFCVGVKRVVELLITRGMENASGKTECVGKIVLDISVYRYIFMAIVIGIAAN